MASSPKNRPQVPGVSRGSTADDSRRATPRAGGAYNPRARSSNCQTTSACQMDTDQLQVITYNVRTLRTEERLIELENALESVKHDIIGLSEVRREGEDSFERNNYIFYHVGETSSRNGVGFLIAKRWKHNIKEFIAYSERIALVKFQVTDTKTLTVVQVYAPTSSHNDDEIEEFYDLLDKACEENRGHWTIVMGDYNAKIGIRADTDNGNIIGPYGLGSRNDRGTRLLQFAFAQNLSISNSFFFKKLHRRWSWVSPDGITRNEIDFCLSSNKQIITNTEFINRLKFSSDHRPLRITLKLDTKILRRRMIKNTIRRLDKPTLLANIDQFTLELKNSFSLLESPFSENTQILYDNIHSTIKTASQKIKKTKNREKKLSNTSKKLIEERQTLQFQTAEYREKERGVKRSIRKDIRNYNTKIVQNALESNFSLKTAIKDNVKSRSSINSLRDREGVKQGDREKVLQICTQFYKALYSSDASPPQLTPQAYSCSDDIPSITGFEVHRAFLNMKYSRSPGDDGITTDALKFGEPILLPLVTNLFNLILRTGNFPEKFCHSNIILLHKKGEKCDIGNYRPISLVSHLYKAFIKVIEGRIAGQLDLHQPAEQAGFRRGLSTTDHLQSLNQLIEKHQEFHIPLYLAFIDFSKAFDSLNHSSIFQALCNQGIHNTYISLLQHIYQNSTAAVKLHTTGPAFHIQRGVKQGDPLSPKLFTATLEEVFKTLATGWEGKGIVMGERRLTNLRFADDIVLFASTAQELGLLIQQLNKASLEVGLSMNMSKTKLMTNGTECRIEVEGVEIEYVQEYLYLGQIVSFQARQDMEIARRIENAWKSYWSMKELMKSELPLTLKKKLMDVCVLPTLTYGAQTWSLTIQQKSELGVCQRAMERSILGIRLSDRVRNTILRSKTQIADVGHKAASLKWNWAGHICRMSDDLWAQTTTMWMPQNVKRRRGRPRRRWRDELDSFCNDWTTKALNREKWKEGREAFALQWDKRG